MGIAVLVITGILHYLLSKKIDYWMTISALGFRSESSVGFLQNPQGFRLLNIILGIVVLISPLFGGIEIYIGAIVLIVIWLISGRSGRNNAYKKYREIMIEMIASEDDGADISDYEAAAAKSNEELAEMVDTYMKYGG